PHRPGGGRVSPVDYGDRTRHRAWFTRRRGPGAPAERRHANDACAPHRCAGHRRIHGSDSRAFRRSMSQISRRGGPVRLTSSSATALRPAIAGEIVGGFWADRRRVNREVSIPAGWKRLDEAGTHHNLELAAGRGTGGYVNELPFLDSDVYKWLEAVAWTFADPALSSSLADRLRQQLGETARLLRSAQQPDGYPDSHFQVRFPGERFVQLQWGHELYCAGHLIQAAVALHRTTADPSLLEVARAAVCSVVG